MTGAPDIPFQGVLGIIVIIIIAWICGGRKSFSWRVVSTGIGLQLFLVILFIYAAPFQQLLVWLNGGLLAVIRSTEYATSYVFGYVGGGETPFDVTNENALGSLAFISLPIILIMSVISALLWHWRVIQIIVNAFARVLQKSFGLSGEVGFGCAANVFFGMVESPLLIRAYLRNMSQGELFILMTCGMATVAGTVMGLYASLLVDVIENPMSHILIASVISAPAAIMLAMLMKPGHESPSAPVDTVTGEAEPGLKYHSSMDAIVKGTHDGLKLLINIVATLIVFVALAALVDEILALLPEINNEPLTLARIFGVVFSPVMWLIGVPWQEAVTAGQLMGTKTILNEFIAYIDLSNTELSDYSRLILTYALCGFANLGSLGIMLSGLITMCPDRTREFIQLSPLSIVSGTLATCMTGAVVGLWTGI